ncbi:LysR family transcriptional regulator [Vibrio sp. Of7-15]|uniref:LysR family transcriptional regulator n=1 Tax=Vibrio sp. Of7-15 TaxID=2724879 RepID=UPI001EF322C7|nr:LysR family transcriptional regulator [Vibrio sp. Of7-15]MCG7498088.1 LysR family transcriptional regulator [Vibrio sp. Of7-15]
MDLIQLSRISLKHLTTLHVMLSTHSVTETAHVLCVSPSSVSKTLAQLRSLLGDELFYRDGTHLIPTSFAVKAEPTVHSILGSMNALLQQEGFDPAHYTGAFRLAMRESSFEMFASMFSHIISSYAPNASLSIYSKEQFGFEALLSGQVDFILLPHDKSQPPTNDKDLVWETILEDDMVCLMNASHPLVNTDLTISDYLKYKHIGIFDKALNQPYFEHILKQHHQPRSVAISVADFGSAAVLCQQSDFLFTCSKQWATMALQAKGLVRKPLPFDYGEVAYSLVWHKPSLNDQAMNWLYQQIKQSVN